MSTMIIPTIVEDNDNIHHQSTQHDISVSRSIEANVIFQTPLKSIFSIENKDNIHNQEIRATTRMPTREKKWKNKIGVEFRRSETTPIYLTRPTHEKKMPIVKKHALVKTRAIEVNFSFIVNTVQAMLTQLYGSLIHVKSHHAPIISQKHATKSLWSYASC